MNASVGIPGAYLTLQAGFIFTPTGHLGLFVTHGTGTSTGVTGGVGGQGFATDAKTMNAYGGPFDDYGGSIGEEGKLTGDSSTGTDANGNTVHVIAGGGSFGGAFTPPFIPAEGHYARTTTDVLNVDPVGFLRSWLNGFDVDPKHLLEPCQNQC